MQAAMLASRPAAADIVPSGCTSSATAAVGRVQPAPLAAGPCCAARPWRASPGQAPHLAASCSPREHPLRAPLRATAPNGAPVASGDVTVEEVMTAGDRVKYVTRQTTVDEALEMIVDNNVSGLPVVDEAMRVVGIVSDFDLLPLGAALPVNASTTSLFPDVETTWNAFKELNVFITKNAGKCVEDVMTPEPLTVRRGTGLTDAAQLLLHFKVRRLPVVDESGRLVGIITRGNIVRAAMAARKAARNAAARG